MKKINFINEALPTSGHLPMYVMHKFFTRKQEDVIREYIQNVAILIRKLTGIDLSKMDV